MKRADIVDWHDPRLEDYRNVPDPELLERRGLFVAEGRLVVARLLASRRFVTRSVLVTLTALRALESQDAELARAATVLVVPQAIINEITGFNIHRGCLAIGERPTPLPFTGLTSALRQRPTPSRIVVLERVANADNVGQVFRHAAAFASDAVLLDPASTDPLYRKAIRTSMGAALVVPFARAHEWPSALEYLRAIGYALVALTPAASATRMQDLPARVSTRPVALLAGHEGDGLTPDALSRCDFHARIPIATNVDSLNVATAVAIALYELSKEAMP